MKYRRIELTAFRRRVTIISGKPFADIQENEEVCINNVDSQREIELESDEGQRILARAVRLMESRLIRKLAGSTAGLD